MKKTMKKVEERIDQLVDLIPILEGEERTAAIDELKMLYDIENKEAASKTSKLTSAISSVCSVVGVVLPSAISVIFMNKGFKFEQTGTYCSQTFKWLQKFLKIGK